MPDNAKSPSEPSMEEIIASISRIITEDKKPNEGPHPVSRESGDILNLTDAVNEDGSVRRLVPLADSPSAQSPVTPAASEEQPAFAERIRSAAPSAPSRTSSETCCDRCCKRGWTNICRVLSSGWFGKKLPALSERRGSANRARPRKQRGRPGQQASRGRFSDAGQNLSTRRRGGAALRAVGAVGRLRVRS